MLFVLLWTFCIVAAVHPIYITNWTSQYVVWSKPKTVNYIATPIATVFAITTTYYFGQCVRFAMRKYLAQRLEARAFLGWSALANKRVVLRERSRWTTFTLLSAVLLAALTTGFTANFTPQQLLRSQRQSPFGELDMSSSAFLNIYTPISQSVSCVSELAVLKSNSRVSPVSMSLWRLYFLFLLKIQATEAADAFGGRRERRVKLPGLFCHH